MVVYELVSRIKNMLNENTQFEANQIVMHVLGINQTELLIKRHEEVLDKYVENALNIAKERLLGKPLQYLLGFTEFMSLPFKVTKDTLIPRSDTETLVEFIIDYVKDKKKKIIDIGTGSGCIGISLAHYTNTDITLLDISKGALSVAAENAKNNKVSVNLINMDILKEYPEEKYDIIVSNPPYIRTDVIKGLQTEVKDYEPLSALDGGEDGLIFYRRIADIAPFILNDGGLLALEIGFDQSKDVTKLLEKEFIGIRTIRDLNNNDRVVIGTLKRRQI